MDESVKSYTTPENDLLVAETMPGDSEAHTGARAFYSQQATEKAIKAALVASGVEPEWIHALVSSRGPPDWYQTTTLGLQREQPADDFSCYMDRL